MIYTHALLLLYWIGYCLLHSLLATDWLKNRLYNSSLFNTKSYRITYNLLAVVLLLWLCWYQLKVESSPIFKTGLGTTIIAVFLITGGLLIMGICMKKYFREMSGLYTNAVDILQVKGLHQFVRHPLYFGTFSFIAGIFIYWPYYKNAVVLATIIIYTLLAIGLEEKKLLKQFGEDYRQYRENVPMIIPFINFGK